MDQFNTIVPRIKVVYYTHPFCSVSGKMQMHWRRLLLEYGQYLSFKFCIAVKEDAGLTNTKSLSACRAVKAAELQSPWAADLYLDAIRTELTFGQQDVTKTEVLVDIARLVARKNPQTLDFNRFIEEVDSRKSRQALADDQNKLLINRINQFPTLTFTVNGKGIKVTGYKDYFQLLDVIKRISPPRGGIFVPGLPL